jgi:acyl carrier protein
MTCIVESTGDLEHRLDQWVRKVSVSTQDIVSTELHKRPELTNPYIAPHNEIEQRVAEVWQAILGVKSVGITDNFLELGGNSLLGTQLAARLRLLFRVNIPLTVLFDAPTIAEMALAIENIIIDEIEKLDEEDTVLTQQSRIEQ